MVFIQNIKKVCREDYDYAIAIVRSLRSNPKNLIQDISLSPSENLFRKYLKWRDDGEWSSKVFAEEYVPQFLEEFASNQTSRDSLNRIYRLSSQGLKISLSCFCDDESTCHRSIIAGLLQGARADVVVGHDYSEYYAMYRKLLGGSK